VKEASVKLRLGVSILGIFPGFNFANTACEGAFQQWRPWICRAIGLYFISRTDGLSQGNWS